MKDTQLLLFMLDALLVVGTSLGVLATSHKRTSGQTLSWLLAFLLLPVAGSVTFIILGYRGFHARKRLRASPARNTKAEFFEIDSPVAPTFNLSYGLCGISPRSAARVDLLDEAYRSYGSLALAMREAKRRIHLEYYIFQPDETGLSFRELLIERAKAGVECRLLYDAVGSHRINEAFLTPMRAVGIEVEAFAPVRLARLWSFHFRNHRKIAVIDGRIGFLGSQNIGNEYLGWKNRGRSWRDIQIRVEGDAAQELESVFQSDWELTTGRKIQPFAPIGSSRPLPTSPTTIAILPTGPDEPEHALEMILSDLLARASQKVTLVTPYFVPSLPVLLGLQAAVRRGIEVELILPGSSDQWMVDLAGRAITSRLQRIGVKCLEYTRSFLHAKVLVIDHQAALIGSANMDERSFRLNWECSALISGPGALAEINASVDAMRSTSRTIVQMDPPSFFARVRDGAIHLLSPLL
jgi:cardiolipin synthase